MRLATVLVGICFLALLMRTKREPILTGLNEFSHFYVAPSFQAADSSMIVLRTSSNSNKRSA